MALQIALMLIFRLMIQLGLSYLAGSRAFYRPVSCEELSSVVLDLTSSLSKYPFSGLAGWLTVLLVSVLPVGLMAWMPAMVILNKPGFSLGMAWDGRGGGHVRQPGRHLLSERIELLWKNRLRALPRHRTPQLS